MRPVLMCRVRAFLEKVERRREERAAEAVEKWIEKKARMSCRSGKESKEYYRRKWREYLIKMARDAAPAKLDLKKVHKFMGHGTGNPICSGDILECYIPSIADRPTAHYPIHWPREIAMDLFSMHCKRFEGDWYSQRSRY